MLLLAPALNPKKSETWNPGHGEHFISGDSISWGLAIYYDAFPPWEVVLRLKWGNVGMECSLGEEFIY